MTSTPPRAFKIDMVSDIVCPWCAIGLSSLQIALERVRDVAQVELHFQPFQLNPDMPPEGADVVDYLSSKYGMAPAQVRANQEAIEQRGKEVGFEFRMDRRGRTWNTFDAHRLLHWAGMKGKQQALKRALLTAYFTDGENPADHRVLLRLATQVGLDGAAAQDLLASQLFAPEVRERVAHYSRLGIRSVPAFIINDRHLIEGGQPPEAFERALRQLAAQA